jgi:hypothetical protein
MLKTLTYLGALRHNYVYRSYAKYSQQKWWVKLLLAPGILLLFIPIFIVISLVIAIAVVGLTIIVGIPALVLFITLVLIDLYRLVYRRDLFNKDWTEFRNWRKHEKLVHEKAMTELFRFVYDSYTLEKLDTSKPYPFTNRMNKLFVKNYKI